MFPTFPSSLPPLLLLLSPSISAKPADEVAPQPVCQFGGKFIQSFSLCLRNMFSANYSQAQNTCKSIGGSLPCISNDAQNLALSIFNSDSLEIGQWIGNFGENNTCKTNYSNWEVNNFEGSVDCVQLYSDSHKWISVDCDEMNAFSCAYSPANACDPGWFYFQGSCFSLTSIPASQRGFTWIDAQEYCSQRYSRPAFLTSIRSAEENNFIAALLQAELATSVNMIWIGAFSAEGQTFKWSDGGSIDYKAWGLDEPHSDGKHPCGIFLNRFDDAYNPFSSWMSSDCNAVLTGFVCRYDIL